MNASASANILQLNEQETSISEDVENKPEDKNEDEEEEEEEALEYNDLKLYASFTKNHFDHLAIACDNNHKIQKTNSQIRDILKEKENLKIIHNELKIKAENLKIKMPKFKFLEFNLNLDLNQVDSQQQVTAKSSTPITPKFNNKIQSNTQLASQVAKRINFNSDEDDALLSQIVTNKKTKK